MSFETLPADVAVFADAPAPEGATPYVGEERPETGIRIVASDPTWPARFDAVSARIRTAIGARIVRLDHVGSTAVPGLAAKPVIDVDVVVADSADEATYVPDLADAGFVLRIREPWWYEHRMLRGLDPVANVHVFSASAAEPVRHRLFRDWLRVHEDDRALYARAKADAAREANGVDGDVMHYNALKQHVIREIYSRAFRAAGIGGADGSQVASAAPRIIGG